MSAISPMIQETQQRYKTHPTSYIGWILTNAEINVQMNHHSMACDKSQRAVFTHQK